LRFADQASGYETLSERIARSGNELDRERVNLRFAGFGVDHHPDGLWLLGDQPVVPESRQEANNSLGNALAGLSEAVSWCLVSARYGVGSAADSLDQSTITRVGHVLLMNPRQFEVTVACNPALTHDLEYVRHTFSLGLNPHKLPLSPASHPYEYWVLTKCRLIGIL
jgi:hypothetical protein